MIDNFLSDLALRNLSPNTLKAYQGDLERLFGRSNPLCLTSLELKKRLAKLPISARSKARHLASLKAFYRWARVYKLIDENPVELFEPIKIGSHLPTVLEQDELEAFMRAVKEGGVARDYALFSLMFGCGLRISEVLSIPAAISHNGSLLVRGKGDKERRVPLNERVKASLSAYAPEDDYLPVKRLFPLSATTVARLIAKYSRLAGLQKRFSAHDCRHTFGYLALKNGRDLRAVQTILGHSNIATTTIYTRLSDEAADRAVEGVTW